MKDLGTIKIQIVFEDLKAIIEQAPTSALTGPGIVSEKALKGEAITLGVKLVAAVSFRC
jgi:hypothetical protein